ncbi:uncharacterized protein LOC110179015 [Drosophila serrata]|uniref:uncharacterized protein LOC110179015 n=1 Tax=Drosophila serrata TaxID=7274 RepID=UPI000A1D1B1A|nr:uncharacterized protein LOC110179015 [Drosophila serrata]
MLDSHVDGDGYNMAGQTEAPGGDVLQSNVPKVEPHFQTQKSEKECCTATILQESFEMEYNLPVLPLKSLMTQMDIMGRLREQGLVRDLIGFKSSSYLERIPKSSEDDACPVPYFIPELQMHCARAEAGHVKETNALENDGKCPSQIEAIIVPEIKEANVLEQTEIKEVHLIELQDINQNNLEELEAPEIAGSSGVENAPEQKANIQVIEEPTSPIIPAQDPIEFEKPMATVIETGRGTGFINSLIGVKPIWRPSVRLCFGDRERKWAQSEEQIKQQTCKALKSLILSVNLFQMFRESIQEESKLNQLERSSGTLTYSRVFKQNEFQTNVARLNRQEELPVNALAGGEPFQRNRVMHPDRIRVLYKLDASDGWARNAPDSDSSDSCDSEDSGIKTTLSMTGYPRKIMQIKHPIADRQDIESSGRILFSKPVTLFRFNSVRQWQREGGAHNEYSYTGDIKILERHGLYYILLREKKSAFLLVYTRIDGTWHIGYMANRSNSCGWFNFNYAFCPEGTPEHFACTFQEPSHAAEFVARVRNLVIKARFLNLPRN